MILQWITESKRRLKKIIDRIFTKIIDRIFTKIIDRISTKIIDRIFTKMQLDGSYLSQRVFFLISQRKITLRFSERFVHFLNELSIVKSRDNLPIPEAAINLWFDKNMEIVVEITKNMILHNGQNISIYFIR